ncbi:hypothetical protein BHM03_00050661 [Ensete ventricosum]|nr:hypothetical protein BHM03_00050661 [Ensete ventricosum]
MQTGMMPPTQISQQKPQATEISSSPVALEDVIVADSNLSDAPESSGLPKGSPLYIYLYIQIKPAHPRMLLYDVAMFLAHRVLSSGELVRNFTRSCFGAEEDEWVNVKKAVRERSIPLESSE